MSLQFSPETYTLSNQLPVILHNTDEEVAAIYWWIKTGSTDEAPQEAGFAHFLEHMLFKDTDAKKTGQASEGKLARAVESLGGEINAYTSYDQTVYHVTCASQHWEKVIQEFAVLARPQKFLKSDFEREREVILEEIKKNEDSSGRMLFQTLFDVTFKKHPYARPVIGYPKVLKAASVKDLEKFYTRQYVSGNMGIVLVGPYDEKRKKKILSLLETSFGKKNIKSKPENRREREFDKPYRLEKGNPKIHTKVLPFDVKTPTLAISFRAPEFKHADIPSLDILTGVLALGESSRLYQELFNKESMVHDVSGGLYVVRDPGMIYFSLESQTLEQLKQASYVFAKVLDRLDFRSQYYQTVTQEEMDRVIQTTESEKIYAAQSVDGIAGRLGTLGFVIGNMNYDRDYLGQLKSLDHEKLEKCFLEYFQASRCSLVVMCPEEQKDEAQSVLNSIREVFEKQLDFGKKHEERSLKKVTTAQQRKKQTTAYDSILLSNGHRVLHRRRVGTQHFSLYTIGMGGSRLETSELSGISHMMAMTLSKGTHSRTSQQIASLVEGKAAALDGFSGRHTNGIQCVGLKRDVSELLDLFSDVLKNPSFDPTEVDHSKRVILESIRSIEENSAQLCSRYFVENLYDEHPYRRLSMGTEENVKKFNTSDLARAHREWLSRPGVVFSLVGDYSDRDLQNLLKQLEMIPTQAQSSIQKLESSLQQPQALKAPRWVERLMDREQVHLIKGSLGLTMKSDDRWAMRLLQDILGGQSGRLFIELREKKSLCYSVAPLSFEGMEAGYVGTYIACSHEKADESLKGIDQVLRACAEQGPSVSELKRAMEYYLGQRAMELQGNSSLATHYGLQKVYDLNPMSESEVAQRVRSVTAKQIQEVCRKYYLEPYSVIAKVG